MAVKSSETYSNTSDRDQIAGFACRWFLFLFFLEAMAAYNVAKIPVPWIGQAGTIALALGVVFYRNSMRVIPGFSILLLFIGWNVFVSAVHAGEFSWFMPIHSTLPYWAYITVRYVNLMSFVSTMYLTYYVIDSGQGQKLVRGLVWVGILVCAISLYIYLAHWFGLPELSRNRLGTSGAAQPTLFTGEGGFYHRATGTFQEPSGLANWLILPFFLVLRYNGKWKRAFTTIIALTLILTVSLTGIFSIVVGTVVALLITRPLSGRSYKMLATAAIVAGLIFLVLTQISIGLKTSGNSLTSILGGRIASTLTGGLAGSNRGYIYEFMAENPFPPFGLGMGNGNLYATLIMKNESVVAFLSLYVFTLYSSGYIGMILLGAFLLRPIAEYVASYRYVMRAAPYFLMAYLAFLTSAAAGSEELTPMFAVAAGLVAFEARAFSSSRARTKQFLKTRLSGRPNLVTAG